jgi:hypothetical protein
MFIQINIEMKKAAHTHHPSINDMRANSIGNNYSIKYVASPSKTYLVNPLEGEIDYSKARKGYDKFFKYVQN